MKTLPLFLLLIALPFMGCQPARFVILSKTPNGVFDNCVAKIKPINKRALKMKDVDEALIGCNEEKVGDTLIVTRKTFANF